MSRRPARFTQAELGKAARVAKRDGMAVVIENGQIRLIPIESLTAKPGPLPEEPEIVL